LQVDVEARIIQAEWLRKIASLKINLLAH